MILGFSLTFPKDESIVFNVLVSMYIIYSLKKTCPDSHIICFFSSQFIKILSI